MLWCASNRADPAARRLADRHYNRQKPDAPQFVPPGSCAVFLSRSGQAFWVTSAPTYVQHEWAGAWINSAFRNEGPERSIGLIRDAVAATRAALGAPPALGMVTFIDRKKVRPTMVRGVPTWGWTYLKAGFRTVGETKQRGYLALQLRPEDMPDPVPALPRATHGLPLFDVR